MFSFFLLFNIYVSCDLKSVITKGKGKGKTSPVKAGTDPEISRRLRLPDFRTNGTCR